MTDWYSTTELGRMRQQEMVQRADNYRLAQQAKIAVAHHAAGHEIATPTSLYRKAIALFPRRRVTSRESGTPTQRPEPEYVAHRVIDLEGVDSIAVQAQAAPSRPKLPPLRRLQTEGDLSRDLRDQLKDRLLDVRD